MMAPKRPNKDSRLLAAPLPPPLLPPKGPKRPIMPPLGCTSKGISRGLLIASTKLSWRRDEKRAKYLHTLKIRLALAEVTSACDSQSRRSSSNAEWTVLPLLEVRMFKHKFKSTPDEGRRGWKDERARSRLSRSSKDRQDSIATSTQLRRVENKAELYPPTPTEVTWAGRPSPSKRITPKGPEWDSPPYSKEKEKSTSERAESTADCKEAEREEKCTQRAYTRFALSIPATLPSSCSQARRADTTSSPSTCSSLAKFSFFTTECGIPFSTRRARLRACIPLSSRARQDSMAASRQLRHNRLASSAFPIFVRMLHFETSTGVLYSSNKMRPSGPR
mmetsp:Transcript_15607/g.39603  ORF Transcript_15607/g.39603 Transcript_15607/m.39603 type:complete len:334 (-) Transcript_15607:44-1045(-)